jgi:tRNA-specific 2-thiouridylase
MARVVVAMSGGVDSSVAAALVTEAGHEAIGVTMKLLPGSPTGFGCCGSPEDIGDARRVAEKLGIRHYVLDFDEAFERDVVDRFVEDYVNQRTPNPCVECNRSVKFGSLLRLAEAYDADKIATGHYARVEESGGRFRMMRAVDEGKDQTYFLHSLTQKELSRVLFPLGMMRKPDVREKARALGLKTADKPESQEICFIPGRDYRGFVRSRAGDAAFVPGDIRDTSGRKLGTHEGLPNYTVGQRKGLGLSGGTPLYVTKLDGESNTLIVGTLEEAASTRFRVGRISKAAEAFPGECRVRIRHRGDLLDAAVEEKGGEAFVSLAGPANAVTPGQSAVFYAGDEVLGGGTIEEVLA